MIKQTVEDLLTYAVNDQLLSCDCTTLNENSGCSICAFTAPALRALADRAWINRRPSFRERWRNGPLPVEGCNCGECFTRRGRWERSEKNR